MEILLLLILAFIFAVVYFARGSGAFKTPAVSPISKQTLSAFEVAPSLWVTASEAAFFGVLVRHMPRGFHVHGKVRLEDIIRVRRDVTGEARWKLRGRVKSRHVDYLITDRAGRPVLAIELDGSAHDPKKPPESDRVKTALCQAVDLRLLRIRVGEDFDHIAATIGSQLRPS